MKRVLCLCVLVGSWPCWAGHDQATDSFGQLLVGGTEGGGQSRSISYLPQAGDLIFFRNGGFLFRAAYHVTFTGPPTHVGIVVALPDSSLVALEVVDRHSGVRLLDLSGRLKAYDGRIWVRRLRRSLTRAQSAELTQFAIEENGKPFAVKQLVLPALLAPLRTTLTLRLRPWRDRLVRQKWFCSELVAAAGIHIGLLDPDLVHPRCTFPRDLFTDRLLDLSPTWEPPLDWQPDERATPLPSAPQESRTK
jgi:hypothetical protein